MRCGYCFPSRYHPARSCNIPQESCKQDLLYLVSNPAGSCKKLLNFLCMEEKRTFSCENPVGSCKNLTYFPARMKTFLQVCILIQEFGLKFSCRNAARNVQNSCRNVAKNVQNSCRNVAKNVQNSCRNAARNVQNSCKNIRNHNYNYIECESLGKYHTCL